MNLIDHTHYSDERLRQDRINELSISVDTLKALYHEMKERVTALEIKEEK